MKIEGLHLLSNVYEANFRFTEPIEGFDFYNVEGVQRRKRYELLGSVVRFLQEKERIPFATYTPSEDENYVVGYLHYPPKFRSFQVEGLQVDYIGKKELPPFPPAYRTLTEILNKTKSWELKDQLWSMGGHFFYPKKWKNLNRIYPKCGLLMFRGPFFRYNILSDGRIILTIDTTTHYIKSESFLEEIRRKPEDLKWFLEEIESAKDELERRGKKFRGIHFYYSLARMDVAIDDVDLRPISKIPLDKPVRINGQECRFVAEFLKAKYPKIISILDETQPGMKSGRLTYAPQFLYRNVKLTDINDRILNEQTYHIDTRSRGGEKDINRPARVRRDLLQKEFKNRGFSYIELGPSIMKFEGPLKFSASNHFSKPKLLTRKGSDPVKFYELPSALRYGVYSSPKISILYLYSILKSEYTYSFYEILREYAKERFNLVIPEHPLPLEEDLSKVRNYLKKSTKTYDASQSFCLAIIENSETHDELTRLTGEFSIPIKCVDKRNVVDICGGSGRGHLENLCASIITRAGGIPWVLYDKLHYDSYVAVDIGRTKSEHWAMGIVYDKDGKFEIRPGRIMRGEDLEEVSMKHCVKEAADCTPNAKSLIFLRHGEVYPKEVRVFRDLIEHYNYEAAAIVSVKERVPYRIFREIDSMVIKPLSGDYYFLDSFYAVLCGAGSDEYEHGMPKPIVAEIIPVKGDIVPEKVLRDLFYLTYLNWSSPRRSYSIPAPLRLAHELAFELSLGIQRYGPP